MSLARVRPQHDAGFTLVELLVVVTLIGVLAAIALPTFLQHRQKGLDGRAKSNARNLVSHMHNCFQELDGFTGCTVALATGTGLPIGAGPDQVRITAEGASGYTIVAVSDALTGGVNHVFQIDYDNATGALRRCTPAGRGACGDDTDGDGTGEW